jgi:GTPase
MFTDQIVLHLVAGKGGNGVVAWRREKYLPKGGPYGGNGGFGGDVVFVADPQIQALDAFRECRFLRAENGVAGGSNKCRGRNGHHLVLKVPPGTLIKDAETGILLCDLKEDGQKWIACQGGRGGLGNSCFKSSRNQAPNFATPGKPGEERRVELELKLIADIGLVGFPNAGKSTFITKVSHSKAKQAPYPFTTLRPNLGCHEDDTYQKIFFADIPGIIKGAHQNRGLGLEFLRHIERTEILLFILDMSGIDGRDPLDDFEDLKQELGSHDAELLEKTSMVALNKADSEEAEENIKRFREKYPQLEACSISALTGDGIDVLVARLKRKLKKYKHPENRVMVAPVGQSSR